MPELPEAEFARTCLERWSRGRRVVGMQAPPSHVLRGTSVDALRGIVGHRCIAVSRHGKQLWWQLDDGLRVGIHLGMTGRLLRIPPGETIDERWARVTWTLDDGFRIILEDPRTLGRVVVGTDTASSSLEDEVPDAWNDHPSGAVLRQRSAGMRGPVYALLMDQSRIAGLGNIQVTEALWLARLAPWRPVPTLTDAEWDTLSHAIYTTLKNTLADLLTEESLSRGDIEYLNRRKGVHNPFSVYGRSGTPCPRSDGGTLEHTTLQERTVVFCAKCQG